MKRKWLISTSLLAAASVAILIVSREEPGPVPGIQEKDGAVIEHGQRASAVSPVMSQAEAARKGSPLAAELNAPGTPPERDVKILRELMGQYLTALQRRAGPPIGDDADFVLALTGRNPIKLTVLPPDHPAISAEGRLLDRWGTPYHLHAKSAQSFEFRSAGPDRRLFTDDDLLAQ